MPKNTLYVTGFSKESKAADLAPDFEKYGDLVRLDIPPPRTDDGEKYAFVEYKNAEDCEKALELDGKQLPYALKDGLVVQQARSDPFSVRRGGFRGRGGYGYAPRGGYGYAPRGGYGGYGPPPRRGGYGSYGPPPPRGGYGYGGYGGYAPRGGYGYAPRGDYGYAPRGDYGRGGYASRGDREYRSGRGAHLREPTYDNRAGNDRYSREDSSSRGPNEESNGADDRDRPEAGDGFARGRYSRSPSRSPVRRDRSRSPERY
ncbi:hypothetical protein HYPBUDRAFT_11819 [Hyphopichia burtonii NRRL Y-1933]|uniref:RRM domain-containing protein n=1 Tax=Hyphopichia burtonii NRRL Y-1933 TaxID=984485 RepID=A0A1E4RIY0_9ASCO|nr:hypothetical protein HYPBUDRAFT_11819 [Hyphopichia burtonii NRRL Y-1933]ODV67227.1 hypothetical protein HYPBUDRAFT_11819 [Hyphopichia burtonii NRRL Y-1933]